MDGETCPTNASIARKKGGGGENAWMVVVVVLVVVACYDALRSNVSLSRLRTFI